MGLLGVIFLILLATILISQIYILIKNVKNKEYSDKYYFISLISVLIINIIANEIDSIQYVNYFCAFSIVIIIIMIIFQAIYFNKKVAAKHKKMVFISICIIISIIVGIILIKSHVKNYDLTDISTNQIINILEDSNTNEKRFILIGRPTCKECKDERPKIESLLKEYKIQALYYDTDVARSENEDLMKDTIKELDVKFVPTILYLDGNTVKEKFTGKDITSDFEAWLKQ